MPPIRDRVAAVFKRFRVPLNVQVETGTLGVDQAHGGTRMGVGLCHGFASSEKRQRRISSEDDPRIGEERSLWLVYRHTIMLPPACAAFIKVTQSELIHRKEKPAKH